MEDEEQKTFTTTRVITAMLVIVFGWGALWSGNYGLHLALNSQGNQNNSNNNYLNLTAGVAGALDNSLPMPSIQPSTIPAPVIGGQSSKQSQTLKILIGGDVMLDRAIRRLGNTNGYDSLFTEISPLFKRADFVAVNLEGPITSNPSKTLFSDGKFSKELAFTFSTKTPAILANAGIALVSLANNHTDNFGAAGLAEKKSG